MARVIWTRRSNNAHLRFANSFGREVTSDMEHNTNEVLLKVNGVC